MNLLDDGRAGHIPIRREESSWKIFWTRSFVRMNGEGCLLYLLTGRILYQHLIMFVGDTED